MVLPLQFGVPGGPELVIVFLILALLLVPVALIVLGVAAFLLLRSKDDGSPGERHPPERDAASGDRDEFDAARSDRETDADGSVHRETDSRPR